MCTQAHYWTSAHVLLIPARTSLTTFAVAYTLQSALLSLFDHQGRMPQRHPAGVPTSLLASAPLFMLRFTKGVHEISLGTEVTHPLEANNKQSPATDAKQEGRICAKQALSWKDEELGLCGSRFLCGQLRPGLSVSSHLITMEEGLRSHCLPHTFVSGAPQRKGGWW